MKKNKFYIANLLLFTFSSFLTFSQTGVIVAGGNGEGPALNQFTNLRGIDVDRAGNIFIADFLNYRVLKYTPGATQGVVVAGQGPANPNDLAPFDVFVDKSGNLYVLDGVKHAVLKYAPGSNVGVMVAGGNGAGFYPNQIVDEGGIFVDDSANVYVADQYNARVVKWAPGATTGQVIIQISNDSDGPRDDGQHRNIHDVFVDKSGNVYIVDRYRSRVKKYAPGDTQGVVVAGSAAGTGGSTPQLLLYPEGVFVDNANNVYVADAGNNRIQKWAPGAITGITVAGGNGAGLNLNQLSTPWRVVVDSVGNMYVADKSNSRILKFPPTAGLSYKYYEGNWSQLPNLSTLIPSQSGFSSNTDINVRPAARTDNFAFLWEGYIKISTPGTYTFETVSDDGSKFYFNSFYEPSRNATVNNDGVHAPTSASGTVYIPAAGQYPVSITYFEKDGGESMQAYWTGPGISRQIIPDAAFTQVPPTTPPPTATGNLSYKYYEGGFSTMPDFTSLTPVKTGTSTNFDINVHRAGVTDSFAIVWDGFINIPAAGSYNFETISDDGSRLFFNGNLIVDNDSLHPPKSVSGIVNVPAAGQYPIKLQYFETLGAESLQVFWSGPGIERQIIPDPAFGEGVVTPPPATGLNYKFYEGDFDVLPDFNILTPSKTGNTNNVDINQRPLGVDDKFAFMWQGYIYLPTPGTYTFETVSDDGSKVYFNAAYSANSSSLINNDGLHAAVSASGNVTVSSAGSYPITITYFEKTGGESMQLYWSGPGITRALVPDAAFSATGTPPPASSAGLDYKYYEGDFDVLPNFDLLTPVKTGTSDNVDISLRTPGVNDHFAFLWEGYIYMPTAGTYTFETVSDDGSKFSFGTKYNPGFLSQVNNDGVHAAISQTGTVPFASVGWYPVNITYFEKDGGENMQVYWTGPGISRQLIPNSAFARTVPPTTNPTTNAIPVTLSNFSQNGLNSEGRIYPNPFRESFTIQFNNSSSANNVQVGIYDLKGRLLYKKNVGHIASGNVIVQVKPGENTLPIGVYIAKLQVNGMPLKVVKLIKTQ